MSWDSLLLGYNPFADFLSYYEEFLSSMISSDLLQQFFIGAINASEEIVAFIFQMTVICLVFVVIFSIGHNVLAPVLRKAARW